MKNFNVPGAAWVTLAALLIAFKDQLQLNFPGADWLPIVVALIGYAAKWVQVNIDEISSKQSPDAITTDESPSAVPMATLEVTRPNKFIQFLVG